MASKKSKKNNNHKSISKKEVKNSFESLYEFFATLGLFGLYILSILKRFFVYIYEKQLKKYVFKLDAFWLKIVKFFSKISRTFTYKFYMFAKFFVDARNVISKGYNSQKDVPLSIKLFNGFGAFLRGVRNNLNIFKTALNYALPIITISAFISLVSYVSSLNFAVAVEYNGEHVGYVENEMVFESAETKLQERMIYLEDDKVIDNIPKFTVAVVNDVSLKSDSQMTDTIIKSSKGDIVKATGLSVDGKFYGAVKDGAKLQTNLNQILDKYKTNTEGEEVSFAKDVKTETGFFVAQNIVNEDEVMDKITTQEQKDVFYTVEEGDTPIIIAAKNDMELDEVVALNSDLLTNCLIGKQVLVKKSQSFLPVKVTRKETYTQNIPYGVKYVDSNKLFKGQTQTSKSGVNGKEIVNAKVEYVDGYEVGRTVISSSTVSEPIDKVVIRGTLNMPKIANTSGKVSNSGLIWPVWGGYISQRYKGVAHNGIDYAYHGRGYGNPIVASIAGKVIYSGTRGSYGKLVIIQSPGGVQTWYAHCSKLLVHSGQTVSQGQQIANIGSTGRSTGNHLHFRVLINGIQKNPINYLP